MNAAGAPSLTGGYWSPPPNPAVLDTLTVTACTATTLTDASKSWTPDAFAGKAFHILTPGNPATPLGVGIASNTGDTLSFYQTLSGLAVGATGAVTNALTVDGLHPTVAGYLAMSAACPPELFLP